MTKSQTWRSTTHGVALRATIVTEPNGYAVKFRACEPGQPAYSWKLGCYLNEDAAFEQIKQERRTLEDFHSCTLRIAAESSH